MEYYINRVYEHYEVFDNYGKFLFSADSVKEAKEMLKLFSEAA